MRSQPPIRKRRITIVPADNPVRLEAVRQLFKEYAASLSFNLCFQSFEEELARLPGEYAPWSGMLLLGLADDRPAGCVALHRLEGEQAGDHGELFGGSDVCEMKRLFVRPEYRGCGVGRELIDSILRSAVAIGYRRMRLDTIPTEMARAVGIYLSLGFVEIAPYRPNPIPGAKYMELDLKRSQAQWAAAEATPHSSKAGE
ncbi:MAG TPA: GNAT family N-acetyltransferase [Terriglobales bacterium]|jgi:putative acetyltransferase|nr:GNAT family N-acetyltransferase [Terriglobales bacterium]